MKREISFILLLGVLGLANMAFNTFTNWSIQEDNNSAEIAGTEMNGTFSGLKATLNFRPAHPEQAALSASIDPCSLNTGFFLKTGHVFSKETLDVKKYPTISFGPDAINKKGDLYDTPGELTIKDLTKRIIISFTFDGSDVSRYFRGNFKIRPKESDLICKGMQKQIPVALNIPQPVLNSHTFSNDLVELATMNELLDNTDLKLDFKRKYQGYIKIKGFTDFK